MLLLAATACSAKVETPAFAQGVTGPGVTDETGLVADWELIGGPDEDLDAVLGFGTGLYAHDFGAFAPDEDGNDVIVFWTAVPCQMKPVAQVSLGDGGIHIEVDPGPNPVEHCAAEAIGYGFRITLAEPVGSREITAHLVDSANQVQADFP